MNALIGLEDGTVLTARSFTGPGGRAVLTGERSMA